MFQPNAPFGGVKQSGFDVEFGEEGLVEYTDIQVAFLWVACRGGWRR